MFHVFYTFTLFAPFVKMVFFLQIDVKFAQVFFLLLRLALKLLQKKIQTKKETLSIELGKDEIAVNGKKVAISSLEENIKAVKKESLVNLRVDVVDNFIFNFNIPRICRSNCHIFK